MKIRYIATYADSPDEEGWEEDHESDAPGPPEEIIGAIIRRFNETLRPHEKARRLVRIVSSEATARNRLSCSINGKSKIL